MGLHSGLAVMYVVSNEFSKVYEIGGPASHLAARLEAAAEPGEIYASEACQKLSEGHIRFESLGLRALRGFADPVSVYRVLEAGDPSRWRVRRTRSVSRFVGRSPDMGLLRHAAQASRSEGRAVCLTGDPGIGKSRLAHEFVQELKAEGWTLIEAGCSPNLQGAPFAALKGVLRSVLDLPPDPEGANPRDGMPSIWQAALDAVLDLPVSDEEWSKLEPPARGQAINDASRSLVETVARGQRTVLLVEDVHWVDRASAPILTTLASLQAPNLLVLLTGRPSGLPAWVRQCNAELLALRALAESAGWAMLDDIVGLSATTYELKRRIIAHTASVPLFIEEVCRRLKETGVLLGEWGDSTLTHPVDDLGIPASVQGVIAARLDRLTKQERVVVQAAAALGSRSKAGTLREVTGFAEVILDASLSALDQAELLLKVEAGTGEALEFPHEMIRQVAYDSMIGASREDVHGRILAALEGEADSGEETDKLCYHATRAKAWAKAVGYGREVARKCVARSAFADATSYYEIAIDAVDKTPVSRTREADAIDLRTEARLAFMGFGRIAEWFDLGKEAERRANAIGDIGRKVATMTMRAAAQNFYGTPVEAIDTSEQVVELAEQSGDRRWLSVAQYGLGQAYWYAGRYLEADELYGRARAELSRPDAIAPIGTTVENMLLMYCMMNGIVNINLGRLDTAQGLQHQARAIADRSDRPFDRVATAYGDGSLALARGDAATAAAVLDEASALAKRHGVRLFIAVIEWQRGVAYLEQQRLGGSQGNPHRGARDLQDHRLQGDGIAIVDRAGARAQPKRRSSRSAGDAAARDQHGPATGLRGKRGRGEAVAGDDHADHERREPVGRRSSPSARASPSRRATAPNRWSARRRRCSTGSSPRPARSIDGDARRARGPRAVAGLSRPAVRRGLFRRPAPARVVRELGHRADRLRPVARDLLHLVDLLRRGRARRGGRASTSS